MPTKKFKSKLEARISAAYPQLEYEVDALPYIQHNTYHPDFKVKENVYIEAKGVYEQADRRKHKLIKEQYPHITVYLLFENPDLLIAKNSKTRYRDWCDKNGIGWAKWNGEIPKEWLE